VSDTPRTDAAVELVRTASVFKDNYCERVSAPEEMVPAAFARTLEQLARALVRSLTPQEPLFAAYGMDAVDAYNALAVELYPARENNGSALPAGVVDRLPECRHYLACDGGRAPPSECPVCPHKSAMSDTPQTDAAVNYCGGNCMGQEWIDPEFARAMERDLAHTKAMWDHTIKELSREEVASTRMWYALQGK
jgi:hypothetical protein